MSELKITTHTTYTYETSDGREFDNEAEALKWQKILEAFNGIPMLDHQFKPTLIPSAVPAGTLIGNLPILDIAYPPINIHNKALHHRS